MCLKINIPNLDESARSNGCSINLRKSIRTNIPVVWDKKAQVVAVDGADDLGGLDFDRALAEHLAASIQPDDERWKRLTNPTGLADLRHRVAFMDEVRQAKERLSRSVSTDLTIPLLDVDTHLARVEVEQVCGPLIARTIRVTQGVIRESGSLCRSLV